MHHDTLLPVPIEPWVDRLRCDHRVWLVKENRPAIVAWAWEPPAPGFSSIIGQIAVQPIVDGRVRSVQVWYTDLRGRGMDRSQLFAPIEGQLPDEAAPISGPVVRQMMRTIANLTHRVEQLEVGLVQRAVELFG